jgi:hypothetical protein
VIFPIASSTPGNFSMSSLILFKSLELICGPLSFGAAATAVVTTTCYLFSSPGSIFPIMSLKAAISLSKVSQSTLSLTLASSSLIFLYKSSISSF